MAHEPIAEAPQRKSRRMWIVQLIVGLLILWLFVAYLIAPFVWKQYAGRHPSFDDNPRITQTGDHHPGDPLNVSLIGTEDQIKTIMQAAKWFPAAKLGLRSDLKIGVDTVLSRPDDEAPVSNLFLFGRKEDLAYEMPVGNNPRQRHHVRSGKPAMTMRMAGPSGSAPRPTTNVSA